MRTEKAILADIASHRAARPEPPGGWISQLTPAAYRAYMKELATWQARKDLLEFDLAVSRKAVTIFITPPISADPERAERPSRKHAQAPEPITLHVLLSDLEAREKELVAAYTPGDRNAYMKIRNLRSGINLRRERYGLPCLAFTHLPRPSHKRRSAA